MQRLWGCAYEMRSLGDVNYKITEKAEGIKLQHLPAKIYNKKAQIELTLLVTFVFVSCFPLASIKCLETSQYEPFGLNFEKTTWHFLFEF
jgi:hypothetical protein